MEFSNEQKLYAEIVQKAWDDADFKNELVANPVAAIESLTGKKVNLPAGKTLVVLDRTDESTVYLNIPAKPELDVELGENELDLISGGTINWQGVLEEHIKESNNKLIGDFFKNNINF